MAVAGDANELADADILDRPLVVQAGAQAVDERPFDDHPQPVSVHVEAAPSIPIPTCHPDPFGKLKVNSARTSLRSG